MPRPILGAAVLLLLTGPSLSAANPKRLVVGERELGRQDSPEIVRLLEIRHGASVAAVGASVSVLLPELSAAVGTTGRVLVVDWDATAIQGVQHRVQQEKLPNIIAIVGSEDDAYLPGPVDLIVLMNSYRLIEDRQKFFEANRKYVRPDTRIAVIDFYRRRMKIGPPVRERVASHRVMRELQRFGYVLVARHNVSPYQYFLIYRLRTRRT